MSFQLPALPYAYNALEPHYDANTVEIHHSKHHQAYVTKLNAAVEAAGIQGQSIEHLLTHLDVVEDAHRTAVRNHAGGVWNHTFFWESLTPGGCAIDGDIRNAIERQWGSFDDFSQAFSAKAAAHFGSGWCWLVIDDQGSLAITDSHDQDCPLTLGHKPLLTLDVWEHAYYIKHQNKRPEWIATFWNIVDWKKVNARFKDAM